MTPTQDDTNNLIAQLSDDPKRLKRAMPKPWQVTLALLSVLLVYAAAMQCMNGLRPDLIVKLTDFWYEAEIVGLLFLVITSVVASVLSCYPDVYQQPALLKLPYLVFGFIVVLVTGQYIASTPLTYPMVGFETRGMACTLCLAGIALIPSALIFAVLKKGASCHPFQAGAFAVFTATGMGALTLRLEEQTDNMMHLATWHYLPTLCFAILGALIGKWLLKW